MKFKSKFEQIVSKVLGKRAQYEPDKIKFVQPAVDRTYIPDWKIGEHVYIETKGKLDLETRKKMVWVKEQHPQLKFYILFQNAFNRITKRSNTTYADWCDRNGFEWGHYPHGIPEHWFEQEEQVVHQKTNTNGQRRSRVSSKPK